MGRRKQKNKNEPQTVISAASAAKKVRAIQRVKNGSTAPSATQYRAYTEDRASDSYISDETSIADPNVTIPFYYERYQDEKLKNIAGEIESRSAEKIHEIKYHVTSKLSGIKTQMLIWMIGTVIVIFLGLIGFHFASLTKISNNLDSKFQKNLSEIREKIVFLEEAIDPLAKLRE